LFIVRPFVLLNRRLDFAVVVVVNTKDVDLDDAKKRFFPPKPPIVILREM
jgi:hypothetical protein